MDVLLFSGFMSAVLGFCNEFGETLSQIVMNETTYYFTKYNDLIILLGVESDALTVEIELLIDNLTNSPEFLNLATHSLNFQPETDLTCAFDVYVSGLVKDSMDNRSLATTSEEDRISEALLKNQIIDQRKSKRNAQRRSSLSNLITSWRNRKGD